MVSSAAIYMHHYKKHRSSPSSNYATAENYNTTNTVLSQQRNSNPTLDNDEDDDSFVNIDYHFDTNRQRIPTFTFSADYNKNYFEMENKHGLGQAYLVGRSQFQLGIVGSDLCSEEVQMHMNIAGLVSAMTTGQRDKLATVLEQVVTVTRRQCLSKRSSNWCTQVPVTTSELRAKYVKGKHALLPNLPRPPVQRIGDHAYVSLIDCVADLLGHGLPVDSIERNGGNLTVSKISESLKAQHIRDNAEKMSHDENADLLVLYVTEWSDGFEPSLSIKGNRGSCWIKSVTIAPPPEKIHSLTHTYPIALGQDGDSHEEVEDRFAKELLSFSSGECMTFYHGGLKRDVNVYLELFVSLQDQPERRSANYIMLGTSRYTARWGLALDFVAVASGIPACGNCFAALLRQTAGLIVNHQCSECVNWDTDVTNGLLDFKPPDQYPPTQIPPSGKLSPKRLTYDIMKAAVEVAHNGVVSGGWSNKNLKAYLRVHGLNAEAIDAITDHAMKCRSYKTLIDETGDDPIGPELAALEAQREQRPELFEMWKFPSLWVRGVQLNQHIDVAMHLLFLGVVKTTMQMIQRWTKERGKHTAFLQYSKGVFESVQKLGLDWCRCVPYKTGKLGGWVSENYLSAARLMNWFYGALDDIATDPTFVEPTRPMNKWTKLHNQGWLGVRGLDTTGNADQVRARVLDYVHQQEGPPPVKGPRGGEVANVNAVVGAMKAMVSRLMCRSVTEANVQDAQRHIKIFLNSFEIFDRAMRCGEDTPTWISSYNFICLTNLPSVLREFGPLRNMWEGGGQGEKILRLVKPTWIGFRKNWQVNMLDRLLRQTAMGRLQSKEGHTEADAIKWMTEDIEDELDEDDPIENITSDIFQGNHLLKRYSNAGDVRRQFQCRRPLSIVRLNNQKFCCVMRNNSVVWLHCTEFKEQIAGAYYHLWQINGDDDPQQQITTIEQVTHYCILLPKLSMHGLPGRNDEPIFTLIESEWKEIQRDKSIDLPRIVGANYNPAL